MVSLNNAEEKILTSLKSLAMTCKQYEENFEDAKLKQIKDTYIEPVITKMGNGLLEAFSNLAQIMNEMKDKDMLDES